MKKTILSFCLLLTVFTCLVEKSNAQISFSIKLVPSEPFVERPPRPSNNHVWIEGEWVWKNNNYVRQPGYWTVPEKDHVWVKGEWMHNPDGSSYWQPGHWQPIPHVGVPNWIPEPDYIRPPMPSPRHLWVSGEWIWQNGRYMYQTGYWTIPEPNKIFIKGHWAQWPDGTWYWVKGYWKNIPNDAFVRQVPPEPQMSRPPAPSPQHVWIDGEWTWANGTFNFVPGHWMLRDPHKAWKRGYWHQRQDGGWFWVEGHWDWI